MKIQLISLALASSCLLSLGCDNLGDCNDKEKARVLVADGSGTVMYAGQALMLKACATGCHSSQAKGKARLGAPASLDFDLQPLSSTAGSDVDARIQGLQQRQQVVFDNRYGIWDQVDDGFMPPSGVGAGFHHALIGDHVSFDASGACTRGQAFAAFSSEKGTLRTWLACGAPVVEVSSTEVTSVVGGTVGNRYPQCPPVVKDKPSIQEVYAAVFMPSCQAGCHEPSGQFPAFDLSSPEKAALAMLGADGKGAPQASCPTNTDPYVTPSDAAHSYIWAKLGKGTFCGAQMPATGMLTQSQLDLLENWITSGAPGP
jgi:hypothetical protein